MLFISFFFFSFLSKLFSYLRQPVTEKGREGERERGGQKKNIYLSGKVKKKITNACIEDISKKKRKKNEIKGRTKK